MNIIIIIIIMIIIITTIKIIVIMIIITTTTIIMIIIIHGFYSLRMKITHHKFPLSFTFVSTPNDAEKQKFCL